MLLEEPEWKESDLSAPRWRHQMETFSALLALCVVNSSVTGEFPSQRPVTRSFNIFFDLCLNKRLSKQSKRWWFETPSYDVTVMHIHSQLKFIIYALFWLQPLQPCQRVWYFVWSDKQKFVNIHCTNNCSHFRHLLIHKNVSKYFRNFDIFTIFFLINQTELLLILWN